MTGDAAATDVLAFWFGSPDASDYGCPRESWFEKNPAFDEEIRRRFGAIHARADAGELDPWRENAEGCLALILVLDQFSRNMFRDDPRAFASDSRARNLARHAVERGFDRTVPPELRTFFYLPFEHSENLDDQKRSLALFGANTGVGDYGNQMDYARRHYEIIERFGRFPHRNTAMGRVSTPEELAFLAQPDSGF